MRVILRWAIRTTVRERVRWECNDMKGLYADFMRWNLIIIFGVDLRAFLKNIKLLLVFVLCWKWIYDMYKFYWACSCGKLCVKTWIKCSPLCVQYLREENFWQHNFYHPSVLRKCWGKNPLETTANYRHFVLYARIFLSFIMQ